MRHPFLCRTSKAAGHPELSRLRDFQRASKRCCGNFYCPSNKGGLFHRKVMLKSQIRKYESGHLDNREALRPLPPTLSESTTKNARRIHLLWRAFPSCGCDHACKCQQPFSGHARLPRSHVERRCLNKIVQKPSSVLVGPKR